MSFCRTRYNLLAFTLAAGLMTVALPKIARAQDSQQQSTPPPAPNPDESAPEAGGPGGDNGSIALPKKTPTDTTPPPPAPKVVNPEGMGDYSIKVNVPLVNVDVAVILDKTKQFVPNLKEGNFRVFEDGVEQKVTGFQQVKQPITAIMLLEFAQVNYAFIMDMRTAAYAFAQQLRPEDYIAVATYDLHTHILTDFTEDKRRVYESLSTLTVPMFSDRNMFDALYEMLDRVSNVEGRKYIILIGSGRDTFSKVNLDKILKKIKTTPDVTIYTISTGNVLREMVAAGSMGNGSSRAIDYAQADNEMRTFASMTGGQWYAPMFQGQLPEIFHAINDSIRNAYVLSYHPTNAKLDGSYRKLKVEVVDPQGKPLQITDEKHKNLKYEIVSRQGYSAKSQVQ